MTDRRFTNRRAVITGGASGAGKAIADRLVREGASVALWDRDSAALTQAAQETGAAYVHELDVTDANAVANAAAVTHNTLGGIDLLVCSAGITGATAPVVEFPIESWRDVIDINLSGVFYTCRAVATYMIAQGYGRIVNIASIAAKDPNPNMAAYAASKAGVVAFTKAFGKELATSGVIVNALTPAVFETPLLKQMPQTQIEMMKSKIPMMRLGQVGEVATIVCWLLSEECSFSTGAVFDISGGRASY